ncbi:hypothetical protein [Sulfitobacter sabulilitoris]|uniref:Uncharacterized protein n=1 Tax=Sulfitobacter sabulilitoris TaxID=2562655 RepID=A0A5S3P7P3_9RHOB|nr:hypothetical protein [Sulfitobacter sabulilitoris]TMM49320.1 hypothetical protein FDT80_18440 [Sulfitobacter sabulilitoris]
MSGLSMLGTVLFVGHSLIGTANPDMLDQLLRHAGAEAEVHAQIINGAPLRYNWDTAASAEGVDARALMAEAPVDALILTEAIPLRNHTTWSESAAYAKRWADLARGTNPKARIYLLETWHSLSSGTGVEVEYDDGDDKAWRDRLDLALPDWQGIAQAVPGMRIIPAGQAMARLLDLIAAGDVAGLDRIEDVFSDDIHPNAIGHYFVAMVEYAVLSGQSPLGLPHALSDRWGRSFDGPDAALAARLQAIAWEVVQAFDPAIGPPGGAAHPAPPQNTPPARIKARTEQAAPAVARPGDPRVGMGLAAVTDWSVQQPFIDVMKTARPWIGHLPRQWGGWDHDDLARAGVLDAQGWPRSMPPDLASIGTLILTDLPPQAQSLTGRYVLRFKGDGIVEVGGRAQGKRYGAGTVSFDFTPGPGGVDIRIQRTNPDDPVREITVVRADHAALARDGMLFNPDWIARIGGFDTLRFMDWMATNESTQSRWDNRPRPDDYTYARHGVPVEVLIALANRTGRHAWFNMPHLADDDYVTRFAETVRDTLDPSLTAYVEFSNEVWNWQFAQAKWADAQATALWNQRDTGTQYYGMRATQVARIWSEVFADEPETRLANVISTQTGWLGLEQGILDAPLWQENAPGRAAAPASMFDAYAVTGYFGGVLGLQERRPIVREWIADSLAAAVAEAGALGLTGQARDAHVAAHRYDLANRRAGNELQDGAVSGDITDTLADLLGRTLPYHAEVARSRGLDLVMYEGGSHVVGIGPTVDDAEMTAFFTQFNYSEEMGALYARLLRGWHDLGGGLFTAYSDVYAPNKWGSWGALRHLDDANPRWDALVADQ